MIIWKPFKASFWLLFCSLCLFFSVNANADWIYPSCTAPKSGGTCSGTQAQTESCLDAVYGYIGARSYQTPSTGQTPWQSSVLYNGSFGATTIYCEGTPQDDTPNPCPNAGAITYPGALDGYFFVATASTPFDTGPTGTTLCLPHNAALCGVKCSTGVTGSNPIVSGYAVACTSLTATGSACPTGQQTVTISNTSPLEVEPETGPGTEPNSPSDCPPGTGFAQVNNKKMCLPSATSGTGAVKTTTQSGNGSTSSTDTITVNGDGTITTTTLSNSTDAGGATTSSTTASTSSPFQEGTEGTNKPYDPGPAPVWTDPGNGGAVADMAVGGLPAINWHQVYLPEGGSCALADIPLTVLGQTITIPLSAACPYLPIFRGLIIFMSVLASIRMFAMAPW